MKITYLLLKNFAAVFAGTKKKTIELDLTKCKNRIVLFIGENGTGKTAIMSNMHPFAFSGNIDDRSNSELILDDCKEGYKEIHIKDDGDLFEIRHIYTKTNNGRTVKSFIKKNGKELNENGNVTSFKEIVELSLGIELDFLNLVRLGSNVTSLIDKKSTERKKSISHLLSDVDIFSKFYKKVNSDTRYLKTLLRTTVDKLNRLNVKDEVEIQKNLDYFIEEKKRLGINMEDANSIKYAAEANINMHIPDGLDIFISNIKDMKLEMNKIEAEINRNTVEIASLKHGNNKDLEKLEKGKSKASNDVSVNNGMIEFYFKQLDALYKNKNDKEESLKYVVSDNEYTKLNKLYIELNNKKIDFAERFKDFNPKFTKQDLFDAILVLQQIENVVKEIYGFNKTYIDIIIDKKLSNENVESYVKTSLAKVEKDLSSERFNLMSLTSCDTNKLDKEYILYVPEVCSAEICPYKDMVDKFYNIDNTNFNDDVVKIKEKIKSFEIIKDDVMSMLDINSMMNIIINMINSSKELNKRIPFNYIDKNNILKNIKNNSQIYDESSITNLISVYEEYEEYQNIDIRISEVKKELLYIEKNKDSLVNIQKDIEILDNEISEITNKMSELQASNKASLTKIELIDDDIKSLTRYIEITEIIEKLLYEKDILNKKYDEAKETSLKVDNDYKTLQMKEKEIQTIQRELDLCENNIERYRISLKEFKTLTNEIKILKDKYDEIEIVKESLASNTGIPLLFIKLYLKNTQSIANKMIDMVYGGDFEICDFIITEDEFKIPYVKNGIMVSDIASCSQGEKSISTIALSMALIEQSIKQYNILLLDEIDATLDPNNRQNFINILESQMDNMNCEQVFLITHNNMFDNYPVDIIMTSDVQLDNYRNINIVYSN